MDYIGARKRFVAWLRQQLIGPANPDSDTLVGMSPLDRYPMGVLFPIMPDGDGVDPASDTLREDTTEEDASGELESKQFAQPARKRRYCPPSAVGFSCFVRGTPRLTIVVEGARYERTGLRDPRGRFISQEYNRIPLAETSLTWGGGVLSDALPSQHFGVDVRQRSYQDGMILTITLHNRQNVASSAWNQSQEIMKKSLFETRLTCFIEEGSLADYPRVDKSLLTEEEQELELQYRHKHIYAIGHGAAVNWVVEGNQPPRIETDFMPTVEVPQVTSDLSDVEEEVLDMHFLATAPTGHLVACLGRFVTSYEKWIERQAITNLREDEVASARRIRNRMRTAAARMKHGVVLLASDPVACEAFRLANQAMLNQMQQQDRVRGKANLHECYRWRPFQLAFLLVVLESTIRDDDDFREVLDLIWFPTGGGKTEAYLGLIVFLIAWRRLTCPDRGGGTVAVMRYTLRLLTSQQFVRATRIIFALELLRRKDPGRLGREPVSIGMWVGRASTPNTFQQAVDLVQGIRGGVAPPNGLVLESCPWCGAAFNECNYQSSETGFHFVCTNPTCAFGNDVQAPLPCNVVDEALYAHPPSLLIGTIDKFARLAWESRAGRFFGRNSDNLPPTLVIQDELHLITGPLGSVAGLYEAALDTLLQMHGVRPKYIASTATIRMAKEQVRSLYGRELEVFPPPGLSCDDSYFARTDCRRPGRLYVGYLAPKLGSRQCLAPLAATTLFGPQVLFEEHVERNALLEAWWTQVVYHTSLRAVGESHTSYLTDVRDWARRLSNEKKDRDSSESLVHEPESASEGQNGMASRAANPRIAQLTSRATAKDNAATFNQLECPFGTDECLDVVLATNMVSVGLDVSRLAVMLVNGQPLTTAEYIQTSSRVGRALVPGLVLVNYHRHQARSLSHYESFRPFHESFYRFVEPTSVTPYTYQVRLRALHAALVIVIRHADASLNDNAKAGEFRQDDPGVQARIEALIQRCKRAEPTDKAGQTADHITQLVEQWNDEAAHCQTQKRALHYNPSDGGANALLCDHENPEAGLWPTLHSMRNVESNAVLKGT